jgi:hypothetical protein
VREVVDIARKHTVTAVNALARIAKDPEQDPRARVAAAQVILDRGYGKATEKVDVSLTTVPTEELERQVLEQLEREGKVKVLKP